MNNIIEIKSENKIEKFTLIELDGEKYEVVSCRQLCEWLGEPTGYLLTCEKLQ